MKASTLKINSKQKEVHQKALAKAEEYLVHEGQLLMALIEVDGNKTFKCFGYTHLTPYCQNELGLSEDVAANFVRVVRKSLEVPELAAAVVSGEIHLSKARTIAPVVTEGNKNEWLTKACIQSKQRLEQSVAQASGRQTKTLALELTFEEHELFARVREALCAKLGHFPTKEEALNWMVEYTLKKIDPVRKSDRSRDRPEDQVNHRDRGQCQIELPDGTKCGERKWLHHHHIVPKELGGPDTKENLITVCASHHRMIHA